MRDQIKATADRLKIPCLVHFTRARNLPSIMQHGLQPVAKFDELNLAPAINDPLRLDGRLAGISTSIALANDRMFYALRQQDPKERWAVIGISREVLWEKDALFCKHNAAVSKISGLADDDLRTPEAFESMFHELEGQRTREEQKLKPFDPTDVQAEVLVLEPIEPAFIFEAAFNDAPTKKEYEALFKEALIYGTNKGYFANRRYNREFP